MNKLYFVFLLTLSQTFVQGCTNTLYQGEIDAMNSQDQERKVVFYWTKTEKLIGKDKAGPAILMTECSTRRLTFVEKENGIFFFGTPGLDNLADQTPITSQDQPCGKIVNEQKFNDIQSGTINLEIHCMANIDEFSVTSEATLPAYIKARNEPYRFEIESLSNWSFLGEIQDAPSPPACRN